MLAHLGTSQALPASAVPAWQQQRVSLRRMRPSTARARVGERCHLLARVPGLCCAGTWCTKG